MTAAETLAFSESIISASFIRRLWLLRAILFTDWTIARLWVVLHMLDIDYFCNIVSLMSMPVKVACI